LNHDQIQSLLPAYALDALTPEEIRAVEAHLPGCPECRRDLVAFSTVAATMADNVVMTTPPPALRARVLEAVRTESRAEGPERKQEVRRVTEPVGAPRSGGPAGAWTRQWAVGLAAAAAVIVLAVGVLGVVVARRLADLNVKVARAEEQLSALTSRLAQQEQLLAIVTNPGLKRATLAGSVVGDVQFVYDPAARQGALVVRTLADPGQDFVYQLWLVGAVGAPQSAGVFRPVTGASLVIPVTADFSRVKAVAISRERGPQGAPQPTAAPILSATL
jgi:anti-sigma-K factor RskA